MAEVNDILLYGVMYSHVTYAMCSERKIESNIHFTQSFD